MSTLWHVYFIGVGFFVGVEADRPGVRGYITSFLLALLWPILFPIFLIRSRIHAWKVSHHRERYIATLKRDES